MFKSSLNKRKCSFQLKSSRWSLGGGRFYVVLGFGLFRFVSNLMMFCGWLDPRALDDLALRCMSCVLLPYLPLVFAGLFKLKDSSLL